MINFLTSVFNKTANARTTCGDYSETPETSNLIVQGCMGCETECMFGCGSAAEQGTLPGGGCSDCNNSCTLECVGNCISWSSISGSK